MLRENILPYTIFLLYQIHSIARVWKPYLLNSHFDIVFYLMKYRLCKAFPPVAMNHIFTNNEIFMSIAYDLRWICFVASRVTIGALSRGVYSEHLLQYSLTESVHTWKVILWSLYRRRWSRVATSKEHLAHHWSHSSENMLACSVHKHIYYVR